MSDSGVCVFSVVCIREHQESHSGIHHGDRSRVGSVSHSADLRDIWSCEIVRETVLNFRDKPVLQEVMLESSYNLQNLPDT